MKQGNQWIPKYEVVKPVSRYEAAVKPQTSAFLDMKQWNQCIPRCEAVKPVHS